MTIKFYLSNVATDEPPPPSSNFYSDTLSLGSITFASLLEAMPQLIPQDKLKRSFVDEWKRFAESRLNFGGLLQILKTKSGWPLYHTKKRGRGVFFISKDRKTVDYLYGYRTIKIKGKSQACSALAYRFNQNVGGVAKEIFFDFVLPELKFVITDSVYTPDGEKLFRNQYAYALTNPSLYNVYAIDTSTDDLIKITEEEFYKLNADHWGSTDPFRKYRFAIELKR